MAKYTIEDTTLTSIGDAIRAKTGSTDLLTPANMATAIGNIEAGSGGDSNIPEEAFNITGNCGYRFARGAWDWFIDLYGNNITTKNITDARGMFSESHAADIPFDINFQSGVTVDTIEMFYNSYISKLPYIKGKISSMKGFCHTAIFLKEIPEDWADYIDWSYIHEDGYVSMESPFMFCSCLKRIPTSLLSNMHNSSTTGYYYKTYLNTFMSCYVLDEIKGMAVDKASITSNVLDYTASKCSRLKAFTFEINEDGTPQTADWAQQVFNLYDRVGYADGVFDIVSNSQRHGITEDTLVTDDASYQALKDNPDWWTTDIAYSRYNHDSAVETINSLPDTSAYLATAGGTNTIKFRGASGSATDGGAINTLTEEEIAVATAKGWTVTLV